MNIKIDMYEFMRQKGDSLSADSVSTLKLLKKMITPALESLRKPVQEEEEHNDCYIMMHILPPDEEKFLPVGQQSNNIRISVHGYSSNLTETIYKAIGNTPNASLSKIIPRKDMGNN